MRIADYGLILKYNTMTKDKRSSLVLAIATVAATGGLLFGFDTGVISGAQNFLQDTAGWGISDSELEWVTTAVLIGAVLGAALSGKVTDLLGRKKVIIITAVIFAFGAIATGAAPTLEMLVVGRIIIGIAIGIASFSVPLYISEVSPTRNRGALVTMNQLMITIGILASYISDYLIANDADPFSWRWMFYVGFFPALILFVGMFFLPETPRWLISKGKEKKGVDVLKKVEDPDLVDTAIRKIKEDIARESETATYREVFKPWLRFALIIALGIMFVQQFTGINTIIYYSPKIFKMAGTVSNEASILPAVLLGIVNVGFTLVSIALLDKVGRRPLYFWGLIGMVFALLVIGASFFFKNTLGTAMIYFTIGGMFIYLASFAVSLGPLGWLYISEVFPIKVRGIGMSLGSLSNWLFNGIVAFTFLKLAKFLTLPGMEIMAPAGENIGPDTAATLIAEAAEKGSTLVYNPETMQLMESIPNPAGSFILYAIIGILGILWGMKYIPETKGISLEEIEDHWRKGGKPNELNK